MWMMGYNDAVEFNTIQDSINGRKLRPLMPKTTPNPDFALTRIHAADLLTLNNQRSASKTTQQVMVSSSRWNPTPDQLQALEELYRRGTRTPSATQIQLITAQLSRFGKIEGKNVFYWFQNHKARERQKRRRQQDDEENNKESSSSPPTRGNGTGNEGEETKNWVSPTNSSTIAEKNNVSTQEAAKAGDAERIKADGWLRFEDDDADHLQLLKQGRNATWQMMHHLSCSSSSSPIKSASREAQTLQLFPIGSGGSYGHDDKEEESGAGMTIGSNGVTPYQFFEFLPLKN